MHLKWKKIEALKSPFYQDLIVQAQAACALSPGAKYIGKMRQFLCESESKKRGANQITAFLLNSYP